MRSIEMSVRLSELRIVVGVSGASGILYAVRLLEELKKARTEIHLVVSSGALRTLEKETDYTLEYVESLASEKHDEKNVAASIASGSFRTDGMVVVPCSMKTLAGIVSGYSDNLILRAADVVLKERRKLILVPRETPLNLIHVENMVMAIRAGAIVLPAMPGFYHRPKTFDDLVNHVIGKIMDTIGIEHTLFKRWTGK